MISSRLHRSIVSLSNLPLLLIYDLIETIEPKDPATHFRNGRNGPFFLLSWGGPGWDLSTPGKSPADPWPEAPSARDPDTRTPGSGSGHSRNPAGFSTGVPIPGRRRSASSGEAYGTTPSAPEVPPSDTHPATPVPRGRSSAFLENPFPFFRTFSPPLPLGRPAGPTPPGCRRREPHSTSRRRSRRYHEAASTGGGCPGPGEPCRPASTGHRGSGGCRDPNPTLCDAHPHRRTSLGIWRTLPQSPSTVRTKREVRNRRSAGCPAPRSRPENGPISTTAESAPSRLIPLLGGLVHGQMKTDDPRLFRFHFQAGIRFARPAPVHRRGSDVPPV